MTALRFILIALLTLIFVGCSSQEPLEENFATEEQYEFAFEEQYESATEEQYEFAFEEQYEFATEKQYEFAFEEQEDFAEQGTEGLEEEYTPLVPENYLDVSELHLNASDVPRGYELNEIEPLENFTIASRWPDSQEALERYESWGRIEGYEVKFNKTRNLDINLTGVFSDIYVACSTFGDIMGAIEDFTYERHQREVVYRAYVRSLKGTNYTVQPMHGLKIGEDSSSHKITYTSGQGHGNIAVNITEVIFRTAYVVCRISTTVLDGKETDLVLANTELEYVAKNQDYLISEVIAKMQRS